MKVQYFLLLALVLTLLVGCKPSDSTLADEPTQPSSSTNIPTITPAMTSGTPDPVAQELILQAQAHLAQKLGMNVEDILLFSVEAVEWPDASLGCPQPGITYAQVDTPGFRVILEAAGERYEYYIHRGRFAVLCERGSVSVVVPLKMPTIFSEEIVITPVSGDMERLVDRAKKDLTRRLEITPDEIEVLRIEKAEWPDTSLGCAEPGLARRPVAIPGYRIILSIQGREYIYHTGQKSGVIYCPKG